MSLNVLAVDPGKLTGWAYHEWPEWVEQSDLLAGPPPEFGELPWEEFEDWAVERVRRCHVVVCENYTPNRTNIERGEVEWSSEQIGVLRWQCRHQLVQFTADQFPTPVKRLVTDDQLKRLGLHHPSKGGHQNDALRHLVYWHSRHGRITLRPIRAGR